MVENLSLLLLSLFSSTNSFVRAFPFTKHRLLIEKVKTLQLTLNCRLSSRGYYSCSAGNRLFFEHPRTSSNTLYLGMAHSSSSLTKRSERKLKADTKNLEEISGDSDDSEQNDFDTYDGGSRTIDSTLLSILDDKPILHSWVTHKDVSFHNFSAEEAKAITTSLVEWYRKNRRKLPWRGDSPPFDGSTAGVNDKKKRASAKSVKVRSE